MESKEEQRNEVEETTIVAKKEETKDVDQITEQETTEPEITETSEKNETSETTTEVEKVVNENEENETKSEKEEVEKDVSVNESLETKEEGEKKEETKEETKEEVEEEVEEEVTTTTAETKEETKEEVEKVVNENETTTETPEEVEKADVVADENKVKSDEKEEINLEEIKVEEKEKISEDTVTKKEESKNRYIYHAGIKTIKSDPSYSKAFYNPYIKDNKLDEIVYEGKETIIDTFEHACITGKDRIVYKYRNVVKEHIDTNKNGSKLITYEYGKVNSMTFSEVWETTRHLASGIRQFCPELEVGGRIGLYLDTCREWYITSMSSNLIGIVNVTCYASLGKSNLGKIIDEGELSVLLCSSKMVEFLDKIARSHKTLKKLIIIGKSDYKPRFLEKIINWDELCELGKKNISTFEERRTKKEDLAFIMYTSGTTGDPKGVMLSNGNIVSAVAGLNRAVGSLRPNDTHLSYLPLSHIFELVIHTAGICMASCICFGNPRTLMKKKGGAFKLGDLECYKPTILIAVPRVYDTIRKGVFSLLRGSSAIKRKIFNSVYKFKVKNLKKHKKKSHLLEKVVFKKIREKLGGRIRIMASGGAPLSEESHHFMQAVMHKSVRMLQGYALSETASSTCAQSIHTFSRTGCVGISTGNSKFRLRDCPELKYFVRENKGEILVSGNSISKGYYKKDDKTAEAYFKDENGDIWFATGDIGSVNTEDNSLSIIDRKKNLVKLSHGEYVALEQLETVYQNSNFVQTNGILVYADSFEKFCVAVILVDPTYVKQFAKEKNLPEKEVKELIKNQVVIDGVIASLKEIAKKEKLARFETVTKIALFDDTWTVESGLLTASFKKKRKVLNEKYGDVIDDLYERNNRFNVSLRDKLKKEEKVDFMSSI